MSSAALLRGGNGSPRPAQPRPDEPRRRGGLFASGVAQRERWRTDAKRPDLTARQKTSSMRGGVRGEGVLSGQSRRRRTPGPGERVMCERRARRTERTAQIAPAVRRTADVRKVLKRRPRTVFCPYMTKQTANGRCWGTGDRCWSSGPASTVLRRVCVHPRSNGR